MAKAVGSNPTYGSSNLSLPAYVSVAQLEEQAPTKGKVDRVRVPPGIL